MVSRCAEVADALGACDSRLTQMQISSLTRGHEKHPRPHVDGPGYVHQGGSWKELPIFLLTFGIPLVPTRGEGDGGVILFPGQHEVVSSYFRGEGLHEWDASADVLEEYRLGVHDRMLRGIAGSSPRLITVEPGDLFVFHHMMPHLIDALTRHDERTFLYSRSGSPHTRGLTGYQDPWVDFPGQSGKKGPSEGCYDGSTSIA